MKEWPAAVAGVLRPRARPAESDARLAELLRDVNAAPTAAELRSPLTFDALRYTRSAHVAALRLDPGPHRRRAPRVGALAIATTTIALLALSVGGLSWRAGSPFAPFLVQSKSQQQQQSSADRQGVARHPRSWSKTTGPRVSRPGSALTTSPSATPPSVLIGSVTAAVGSAAGSSVPGVGDTSTPAVNPVDVAAEPTGAPAAPVTLWSGGPSPSGSGQNPSGSTSSPSNSEPSNSRPSNSKTRAGHPSRATSPSPRSPSWPICATAGGQRLPPRVCEMIDAIPPAGAGPASTAAASTASIATAPVAVSTSPS